MLGWIGPVLLALATPTLRNPGYAVVADAPASTASQLPETLRDLWPDRFATSSAAKKAVRRKLVLVGESDDGPRLDVSSVVESGTRIRLLSRVAPGPAAGEGRRGRCDDPLECCYEDDHLAVVYKPPGLSVQGDVRSRIAVGLQPSQAFDREPLWRPQHVHRLDSPTSGLLVVAKTGQALRTLSASFADRHVHKTYHAVVVGSFGVERGSITLPLSGQDARTDYRVLGTYPSAAYGSISLVSLSPITGRTHQLRRHMALLGHPILGDHKYWPNHLPPHERQEDDEQVLMLSAVRLEFPHPVTGASLQVQASQPKAFDKLCDRHSTSLHTEEGVIVPTQTFSRPFLGPFQRNAFRGDGSLSIRRRATAPLLSVAPPPTTPSSAATPTPPPLQKLKWSHLADFANGDLIPTRALDADGHTLCYALTNDETAARLGTAASLDRYRVGFYFGLWYILSVVYSVKNKQAHIALGLPLSIATAQVGGGAVVAALLWGLRIRTPPKLSSAAFRTLLPIGLFHGIGHLTGVLATALGSVSFVQVVKSAGPFWACILSGIFLGQRNSRRVWLSLVPVVGGVGLASANELKFVWSCFFTSVASDIALATRNVLSKKTMGSHTQVR